MISKIMIFQKIVSEKNYPQVLYFLPKVDTFISGFYLILLILEIMVSGFSFIGSKVCKIYEILMENYIISCHRILHNASI